MNFEVLSVTTYCILFMLWSGILYLYISNIRSASVRHSSVGILLAILALDAFRTSFESAYFGLYFGSLYNFLNPTIHQFLSEPVSLLLPKFINLLAALVVLTWLLKVWIPRELKERKSFKHALDESSRLLELTQFSINHVADALFWVSPDGEILEVNNTASQKLGFSRDELMGMFVYEIDPEFTKDKWPAHWTELKKNKTLHFNTKHITKSGRVIPVDVTANFVSHAGKEYNCAVVRDMTNKSQLDELIWRQANYDELTDLPNRRLYNDRLNEAILHAKRNHSSIAVVFIDLDHFKDVNDLHGHNFGDRVLTRIATNLTNVLRESDTLARFAGDEFAAILPNVKRPESIQNLLNRMLSSVIEPMLIEEKILHLSASIGVTFYPNDAVDVDNLLINADQAMYQAKNNGRNQIYLFTPDLTEKLKWRTRLINDLRDAIHNNELELYYQPVIDLKTHQLFKVEALLRWEHEEQGAISPSEFIPLAEETSLIMELGDYVVDKALQDMKKFKQIDQQFIVGINTSPEHYKKESYINNWLQKILAAGLKGSDFVFEITERILMPDSHRQIDKTLKNLDATGVKTAIDDFGTGYSSLAYIKKFNIDIVKIDKSFVANVMNNAHDQAICEAITLMSHKLGMKVIAEGVETVEQSEFLTSIGCDYAQGYYFSKPLPLDNIITMISNR